MPDQVEVVEEIKKEIKRMGDGHAASKKNYDELRREFEELKGTIDQSGEKVDVLVKEKVDKISQAITTRQDDIDTKLSEVKEAEKKFQERIDQFELRMKNSRNASPNEMKELEELGQKAAEFAMNAMVVQNKTKGVKFNEVEKILLGEDKVECTVEQFKDYTNVFRKYCRVYDSQKPHVFSQGEFKSLSLGIDPDGGYTVTPMMSNRIITRLYESDPIRQLASVESITTDALEWLVDYGQAGFGWEAETTAGDETTTPDFRKKRIPVHVMYAKPQASQTLLEDSAINIESWLADHVAKRFMRGEAAAFVSGSGVGQPRGFLTYSDYDTAGTDQWGRIEQTAMGAAAALTADGFINLKYSLIEQYLTRGTWLMNRLTVAAAMLLKDGQGNYIWKPGLTEERNSTILGLDVRMSTTMPTVAAGALSVAIADWAEAYMIVDRLGITIQRDPYTQKPMVEFYTRKRVGGDVCNYQAIKLGVISAS